MWRVLMAMGLLMAPVFGLSKVCVAADVARIPSGIGSLNLFIRHESPTVSRKGLPVLILHGATFPSGNAAGWKIDGHSWMDELAAAGYDVYAFDFLGYGESDRYPEMSSESAAGAPLGDVASMVTQVEAAVRYIRAARGVRTVNLVAHSAGTFVAARYTETHPQDVERLVLFGSPAPYDGPRTTPEQPVRYVQVSREDQLDSFEPRVRESQQLDPSMFDSWASAYLATDPLSASRAPPSVRVPSGMIAALRQMRRSGQLPYEPDKINAPVLVIQGEWDATSPPAAGLWIYQHLASAVKRFVIISRAGHRAHLERNRWQLYREVESFLNANDGSEPVYGVFFEVKPNGSKGQEQYLAEASRLKPLLAKMSGFIDVERFTSETRPGWLLSFSRWRDESALVAWREVFEHRAAQEKGRQGVFEDYRIRVARQVETGGDFVLAAASVPAGAADTQLFVSINDRTRHVTLVENPGAASGTHWQVIRDYGMHNRNQAPRD